MSHGAPRTTQPPSGYERVSRIVHGLVIACVVVAGIPRSTPAAIRPKVKKPSIAVYEPGSDGFFAVSLTGTDFGPRVAQSSVEISGSTVGTPAVFPATHPSVIVWENDFIVVKVVRAPFIGRLPRARVRVWDASVQTTRRSNSARADVYRLARYDLAGADAPGGSTYTPGNMWSNAAGRVFISAEFYRRNAYWDPATDTTHPLQFPLTDGASIPPGDYAPYRMWSLGGCYSGIGVEIGEGVTVDGLGRGWFTLGGSITPGPAGAPNHAQIVMYDPEHNVGRIYYLPGDDQLATGIAWDPIHGRIWAYVIGFGSWVAGPFLVSFDPDTVCYQEFTPSDPQDGTGWNFLTPLTPVSVPTSHNCNYTPASCVYAPGQYIGTCSNDPQYLCKDKHDCVLTQELCPGPGPGQNEGDVNDANCYHAYFLPGTWFGIGIGVDRDGAVWFANSIGPPNGLVIPGSRRGYAARSIGRLDPETGAVQLVPLPTPLNGSTAAPYELRVNRRGDVVTNLTMGNDGNVLPHAIARLDRGQFLFDPNRCLQLVSPNPADNCTIGDDPTQAPPPSCQNPCVEIVSDSPNATYRIDADPLEDRTWYGRGYVRHKGSHPYRVLFPPIGLLYPSVYRPLVGCQGGGCQQSCSVDTDCPGSATCEGVGGGFCVPPRRCAQLCETAADCDCAVGATCDNLCHDVLTNPHVGLGEGVAIDHRPPAKASLGHAIWGKAGCGNEMRRLTPVDEIGS